MNDDKTKAPLAPPEIVSDAQGAISDLPGVEEEKEITPRDKLRFAKQILLSIAILFVLSFIMSALGESTIFESCKEILPPIATVVIGYYFGAMK